MRRLRSSAAVVGVLSLLVVLAACSDPESTSEPTDLQTATVVVDVPDATPAQVDEVIEVISARLSALDLRTAEVGRDDAAIQVVVPAADEALARTALQQSGNLEFRPVLEMFGQVLDDVSRGEVADRVVELRVELGVPEGVSARQVAEDEQARQQAAMTTTSDASDEQRGTSTTSVPPVLNQYSVDTNAEAFFELFQLETQLGAELTPAEEQSPDAEVTLADDDGMAYLLGPVALTGAALERATATTSGGEWVVGPVFERGAEGIDRFNEVAASCYAGGSTCPALSGDGRGLLGVIVDGLVLSAPSINVSSFERDQIQISGSFDETSARALAAALSGGAANTPWIVRD